MTEQKIEAFWRDATAEDVAGIVKTGKPIPARIRNANNEVWREDLIAGWSLPCFLPVAVWIDEGGVRWRQCQVYEPQQWWLDKPDPGEGWRLLEKFPPEGLQPGDEWFEPTPLETGWKVSHNERQANTLWYRRRIEPVKQDAGSTCASTIPKGWTALLLDEPRLASDAYWSLGAKDWIIIGDARLESANRDKWPAIRRVENQISMKLMADCCYTLPSGHSICVTETGFEVLLCHGRT
jgi:hypothetical protein